MKLSIKLAIAATVILVVISAFSWIAFPALMKSMIKKNVVLKPGGDIRNMWLKIPFPVDFKVYMFNITNARDVHNGDSPVLDEIGPFFFDEWKEKVNVSDNESEDTVAYNTKTTYIYNQEKSGMLTMDETITIVHPMMTGMILSVARDTPALLSLLDKAINEIFDNPDSIFITSTVQDILFNGLLINCTVNSFAAKAVCAMVKLQAKDMDVIAENEYLFSFFGVKNKTLEKRLEVKRGMQNSHDVGRVLVWDNKTEMQVWSTDKCNQYHGTDSTIFPPFLEKEEGLWSFAPDMCRSLGGYYVEDSTYNGLPVRIYKADLGDMSNNEEDKCYCRTNTTCLKKGILDLTKCTGAPIILSLPHFYKCDPSYLAGVRGLRPDEDKHGIKLVFEHMTGTPVSARKRLQFNLPVQKVPKISFMKTLPDTLLPIMWIEEGVSLGPEFTKKIDDQLFKIIRIMDIIKWVLIGISLVLFAIAAFLHFYKSNNSAVTPAFRTTSIPPLNGINTDLPKNSIKSTNSIENNEIEKF